ncbi:MAG: thioredoxin [Lachnospiraceae bacterium]|jgi:thioredoxin 1|nr:thioredoxin [Lachnospiraceae bacterium]MBQ3968450.1 thioredoxin [Lachnospiraceae bacterium]
MVKVIRRNEFEDVKKAGVAVVDFSATWCNPCRMLAPVMEELSDEYAGAVEFYNCDVDENGDLASDYGITSIPAIIIFKEGKATAKTVGFQPKANMKSFIDANK